MQRLAAPVVLGLVLAGCGGSDDEAHCDSRGDSRLCLVESPGSYSIEFEDLEPGTDIVIEVDGERWAPQKVPNDGSSSRAGVNGLLGVGQREVSIEGIAADGQELQVTLNG